MEKEFNIVVGRFKGVVVVRLMIDSKNSGNVVFYFVCDFL